MDTAAKPKTKGKNEKKQQHQRRNHEEEEEEEAKVSEGVFTLQMNQP